MIVDTMVVDIATEKKWYTYNIWCKCYMPTVEHRETDDVLWALNRLL